MQAEVELRWMQFVVAVAEERNFTRAATRCHVSQPALSRQIKNAEDVLGARLFERRTRSVSITKAGHLFIREARRTLEQGQRTVSLVRALVKQEERPLDIGLSALADLPRIQRLIERVARTVRGLSFSIHSANTPELMLGLLRGDIDLAAVDLPVRERGIRCIPLFTESLVAVLPERQLSTKRRPATSASLSSLLKSPLALLALSVDPSRTFIEQHLSTLGTRAFCIHDAASVPDLLDLVALHNRTGLLRQSAMRFQRQSAIYKPLSELIEVGCGVAWRTDNHRSALLQFRDALLAFSSKP